jgi:hypothetical protein
MMSTISLLEKSGRSSGVMQCRKISRSEKRFGVVYAEKLVGQATAGPWQMRGTREENRLDRKTIHEDHFLPKNVELGTQQTADPIFSLSKCVLGIVVGLLFLPQRRHCTNLNDQ